MSTTDSSIQPPPPPLETIQEAYTARSGHGSVGPVIGVLAVITVLGAMAVMIGRLCSGRWVVGNRRYDFEGWVETKCASCIEGRVDDPPPPPPQPHGAENTTGSGTDSGGEAEPAEEVPEAKEEEITRPNNPQESGGS